MSIENGPNDDDFKRALQLLLFTHDVLDAEGVNHVFSEIGETERAGQTILAVCEIAQMVLRETARLAPGLEDEIVATMRRSLMKYELSQMGLIERNDDE